MEINAFSFERGPRGERGPGRAQHARARQKRFQIQALLARARRAQDPIHPA